MHILFVDDEPAILRSIRRVLRGSLDRHHIDLVDDPLEAVDRLKTANYDLVVSDMRMPGKDGCYVLSQVEKHSPRAVRAILSGYSDEEQAIKAAQHAHLFLSKPFESSAISDLVQRAEVLSGMPLNDGLRRVLGSLMALTPAPRLFAAITDKLTADNEMVTAKDIAEVLLQDMGMTTKILQLTNSAFFGLTQPVQDLERAVNLLGMDVIKGLVLHHELLGKQQQQSEPRPWCDKLYRESQHTARLAKSIVRNNGQGKGVQDSAFLAGLLHDMGRLVLADQPEAAPHVDDLFVTQPGMELCAKEVRLFGAHHGWVGAYLLKLWGFSDLVVDAVALHHDPSNSADTEFSSLTAVHVAGALLSASGEDDEVDEQYLKNIGCHGMLPQWRELARD